MHTSGTSEDDDFKEKKIGELKAIVKAEGGGVSESKFEISETGLHDITFTNL